MIRKTMKNLTGLSVLLSVLFLAVPGAQAWWDANWQFRRKITLNTGAAGVDPAAGEMPVLVRLHTANFDFTKAKSDGSDIRFVGADDVTPLKYHIEKFDPVDEMALVWVKVPRLDAVHLYYGNPQAADAQSTGATYDAAQQMVLHFSEVEGTPRDSGSHGNHPSQFSAGAGLPAAVGNGIALRGAGDQVVIPRSPSVDFSKGFTFSAWVRVAGPQGDAFLFSCEDDTRAVVVGVEGTRPYLRIAAPEKTVTTRMTGDLTPGTWHHLTVTAEPNGKAIVYLDGKEAGSNALPMALPQLSGDLALGVSLRGNHSFSGEIDEVQVAGVPRSAAWILAAAQGQGGEGTLLAFGAEEAGEGEASTSNMYVTTVARNISMDGWLIIGMLLAFGAFSGIIFLNKVYTFRQMVRENREFFDVFRKASDPAALAVEEKRFCNSPLFRIYQEGMEDLRRWADKHAHLENPRMSPKALNVFKSVLESGYMMENRRINKGLVVMTMGISGGPFLGLLGTVWGVMNTFAGMAIAGEANLAAIAPGIASALATTVFGLIVAIPALFAYNYLASQVKIIAADIGMFVDQFANMADHVYGRDE